MAFPSHLPLTMKDNPLSTAIATPASTPSASQMIPCRCWFSQVILAFSVQGLGSRARPEPMSLCRHTAVGPANVSSSTARTPMPTGARRWRHAVASRGNHRKIGTQARQRDPHRSPCPHRRQKRYQAESAGQRSENAAHRIEGVRRAHLPPHVLVAAAEQRDQHGELHSADDRGGQNNHHGDRRPAQDLARKTQPVRLVQHRRGNRQSIPQGKGDGQEHRFQAARQRETLQARPSAAKTDADTAPRPTRSRATQPLQSTRRCRSCRREWAPTCDTRPVPST